MTLLYLEGARFLRTRGSAVWTTWRKTPITLYGEVAVAEVVAQLTLNESSNWHVVIYPIIPRDIPIIENLAKMVKTLGNPERVAMINQVQSIETILALYASATFSINYKLHAMIMSFAMKTPFISFAYRLKCFDFAASVGMTEYVLYPNEVTRESLEHSIGKVLARASAIREHSAEVIEQTYQLYYSAIDAFAQKWVNDDDV